MSLFAYPKPPHIAFPPAEPIPAPWPVHEMRIPSHWIDFNKHLNVAFYVLAFDFAAEGFCRRVGLGFPDLAGPNSSTFVLENHTTYDQEVMEGDLVRFEAQLLGFDAKKMHIFYAMYHVGEGYLSATHEQIMLHVDMSVRRSAPMAQPIMDRLGAVWETHQPLAMPAQAGRSLSLTRKKAA